MTTRRTTRSGFMLWFAMVIVFACTMGLVLSGGVDIVVEFLGDSVDYVIFNSPEQIERYKEIVK